MAGVNRRRALIVGIDEYENDYLGGCVEDAERMKAVLAKHADNRPNYNTQTIVSGENEQVTRGRLRAALDQHFAFADGYDLFFYFAGHGVVSSWGPELVTYDYSPENGGISMQEIAVLAQKCKAREVTVVLDCCFSGSFADPPDQPLDAIAAQTVLTEDMAILAASRDSQASFGDDSGGVFTSVLVRGLEGAAANVLGYVTPLGLHEFVSRAFEQDPNQQPVLKTYQVHQPVLREVEPRVPRALLDRLLTLFSEPEATIGISTDHVKPPDGELTMAQEEFAALSILFGAGLVELRGLASLSHAADGDNVIALSPLGRYYYELLEEQRLS
jgi:uncharacterized caspase-like protein